MAEFLLEARGIDKSYPLPRPHLLAKRPRLTALTGVDLTLRANEILGIVGESGSGKSTLARLLMAFERPDRGQIRFEGEDLAAMAAAPLRARRRDFQMVFQDPFGSLDPRMRIADIVAEPLDVAEPDLSSGARQIRIGAMLERVGLEGGIAQRYPHQFSGGQRQRIAIARALITRPKLVIADEPVSALDVSIQAQILNLLLDLRAEFGLAMVFISHDLGIVRYLADRVMVMKGGVVVESGEAEAVFSSPRHAYTQRLLAALDPALSLRGA